MRNAECEVGSGECGMWNIEMIPEKNAFDVEVA
jgi:hypothetical protein